MKKLFFVLVAVIGFCFSVNAQNCDQYTCTSCGATLHSSSQAYWVDCWNCGGDGLVTGTCKGCESCSECNQTGKQKCRANDGTYGRWTHCNNCSLCRGTGWRDVLTPNYTGCTTCGGNSNRAGTGGKWHSGCKCSRCGKGYR